MTIASIIEDKTLAVSAIGSPLEICNSEELKKIVFPPSLFIATSKETRVLVEGF